MMPRQLKSISLLLSVFGYSCPIYTQVSRYDVNLDNRVDVADITAIVNYVKEGQDLLLDQEGRIILYSGQDSIYLPLATIDSIRYDKGLTENVTRMSFDTIYQTVTLPKAEMPENGMEYFRYAVNTSMRGKPLIESFDYGFIRLPSTYTASGAPTRLIMLCHGAGAYINGGSKSDGDAVFTKMLQAQGYAILCFDGLPACYRNEKYMATLNHANHLGGPAFLNCAHAVYSYVMDHYNLDPSGILLLGRSMGGGAALNLAFNGTIPIRGMALDAPAIDFYLGSYFNGMWGETGSLDGWNPALFAWIYQWDYCDLEAGTYTIPAASYTIDSNTLTVASTTQKSLTNLKDSDQDMAILWELNKDKMVGYNPYKTNDYLYKKIDSKYKYPMYGKLGFRTHLEDNEDQYFQKKLPCPCMIWVGATDDANCPEIDQRFVYKCKKAQSVIGYSVADTDLHMLWDRLTDRAGNPTTTDIGGMTCSKYAQELLDYIRLLQF